MPFREQNSMVRAGTSSALVEDARVINVHQNKWLVDVRTRESGKELVEVEVMSPYLHFHSGEGSYVIPEIGALVKVCTPSDSPPFVLGFVGAFEREEGTETFRGGRPKNAKPGDLIMQGRDGNRVWLHRGGVLEIGSNTMPRRLYVPLMNVIRDVTLKYELISGGGSIDWDVEEIEDSDSHPESVLTLLAYDKADDSKGSIRVKMGHVSDSDRLDFIIAPSSLDKNGEPSSSQVYRYKVDKDGNVNVELNGDYIVSINGDAEIDISGDLSISASDTSLDLSSLTVDCTGTSEINASRVTENITGSKVVDCPLIQLGGSGGKPVVIATSVFAKFLYHTHSVSGPTTGPPTEIPLISSVIANRVTGK